MTQKSAKLNYSTEDEITAGMKKAFDRMLSRDVRVIDDEKLSPLNKKLSPLDKLVGIYLSDMCMNGRDHSWPSYRMIATECGCSERAAISSVKMLEKFQYIRVHHRFNERGHSSNVYFPAWHLLDQQDAASTRSLVKTLHHTGEKIAPSLVKSLHGGNAKFAHKTPDRDSLVETSEMKQTPAAPASESTGHVRNLDTADQSKACNDNWPLDALGQFRSVFPYQEYQRDQLSRDQFPDESEDFRLSEIELHRLRRESVEFHAIIAGAIRYRDHVSEKQADYILSPQKWLRNGHWEDDYDSSCEAA